MVETTLLLVFCLKQSMFQKASAKKVRRILKTRPRVLTDTAQGKVGPEYNEENTVGRKCSSLGARTNIPYRNSSAKTVTCEEMTII